MTETDGARAVRLALELRKLGVSHTRTVELLSHYDHATIDEQLRWLPWRKCNRPAAFIIEAIRDNYSPPNEFYHAQLQGVDAEEIPLDEDSELPLR